MRGLVTARASVLLLLLAAAAAGNGSEAELGDRALSEGRYADAVRHYVEAERRDGAAPRLLLRLGEAYAKSGDLGRAVLSHERARLLAPRDREIRGALAALRRAAGLESDLDRGWLDAHRHLSSSEWASVGLGAAGILLAALVGRRRFSRRTIARLLGAAALLALPAMTGIAKHALERDRAIVLATGDLRAAPDGKAAACGTVRAGQAVRIARSSGEFVLVAAPGGPRGWLACPAAERIRP